MATAARRDWRFNDDLAGKPRAIPKNWFEAGAIEPLEAGDVRTFAALIRIGTELEWTVEGDTPKEGPHRERPAVEVLYATVDGEQAHARIVPAEQTIGGVRPSEFTALASADRDTLNDVGLACQPFYRALIAANCGEIDTDASTVLHAWRNDGHDGLEEVIR